MLRLLMLSICLHAAAASYLNNDNFTHSYLDVPTNGIITSAHQYPYIGFGCTATKGDKSYLITSSYNPYGYSDTRTKCSKTKKYVEIMEFDFSINNFTNSIVIGDRTGAYPNAVGNLGSDMVTSCGIDTLTDTLYYVGSNPFGCASSYNYDSSLVRIALNNLTFIDRTILRAIDGIDSFSESHAYYEYRYINAPTTTYSLNDGTIWLGFGTYRTGIWRLDISGSNVSLVEQLQKPYLTAYDGDVSGSTNYYTDYIQEIKKNFINEETGILYFLEDTGWRDAQLLAVNISQPATENSTGIIKLDGLTHISDIKVDYTNKRIYIVSGQLSSELYQYDYSFNKLSISDNCNVDFVKFPTEWGVITKIEVDHKSGFIYAILSTRHGSSGIVRIKSKDLSIEMDQHLLFGETVTYGDKSNEYSYYNSYINFNITALNLKYGKLLIAP